MREIIIYGGRKHDYKKQYLTEGLYAGDAGYVLVVKCGQDVSECAVEAIVARADGAVFSFLGFAAEKEARCTLPSYAVGVPGKWEARVRAISGGSVVTEAYVEGYVYEAAEVTDAAYDDRLPILTDLLARMKALELEIEAAEKGREEAEAQRRESSPFLPEDAEFYYGVLGKRLTDGDVTENEINSFIKSGDKIKEGEVTRLIFDSAGYDSFYNIISTKKIARILDKNSRDDTDTFTVREVGRYYVYSYPYETGPSMTFTIYF